MMIKSQGHSVLNSRVQAQISHHVHTQADTQMYSPTHIQCPDGTTQGHLRKQLQMVPDAAEGLGDSSSLYIYLGFCVFMQGHGSYPGLGFDVDKERTAAVLTQMIPKW